MQYGTALIRLPTLQLLREDGSAATRQNTNWIVFATETEEHVVGSWAEDPSYFQINRLGLSSWTPQAPCNPTQTSRAV